MTKFITFEDDLQNWKAHFPKEVLPSRDPFALLRNHKSNKLCRVLKNKFKKKKQLQATFGHV